MKGAAWILIGVWAVLAAQLAESAEVDVTWQYHGVGGRAGGHDADGNWSPVSYSLQGPNPVSGSASAQFLNENDVWVPTYVESSAGDFSVEAIDGSWWTFTGSYALARSEYVFRPLESELPLHFTGQVEMHSFENEVSFELYDEESSVLIDAQTWTTDWWYPLQIDWLGEYTVDPTREYRLIMRARVAPGDHPCVTSLLEVDLTPEPAAALVMLVGLMLFRRRG